MTTTTTHEGSVALDVETCLMECCTKMNLSIRTPKALVFIVSSAAMLSLVAACSADHVPMSAPRSVASSAASYALTTTSSTTFTLQSVTPAIQCTDASGATTTVTAGTAKLANGKFTATFATITTNGQVTTTSSQTEMGTFTQSGSTLVFKVTGAGTLTGTLDGGTLTIANYPFCGATHTAVFTRV
jgi:hypothetical protein